MKTIFKASIAFMLVLTLGVLSACAPSFDDSTPLSQRTLFDGKIEVLLPDGGKSKDETQSAKSFRTEVHSENFGNAEASVAFMAFDKNVLTSQTNGTEKGRHWLLTKMAKNGVKTLGTVLSDPIAFSVDGAESGLRSSFRNGTLPGGDTAVDGEIAIGLKGDTAGMVIVAFKPGSLSSTQIDKIVTSFKMN